MVIIKIASFKKKKGEGGRVREEERKIIM